MNNEIFFLRLADAKNTQVSIHPRTQIVESQKPSLESGTKVQIKDSVKNPVTQKPNIKVLEHQPEVEPEPRYPSRNR